MISAIRKRRSIRRYADKTVPQKRIDAILMAAMFSPSAHNHKAWEFVVVDDPETIIKLANLKPQAYYAETAPLLIVVCSRDWQYWVEDAATVAAHICLEATEQGLGACMVEVFDSKTTDQKNAEEYVREALKIPNDIRILCFISLGFAAEEKEEHQDSEFDQYKIHKNRWLKVSEKD